MFQGFATISFYVDDLAAGEDWYAELLGVHQGALMTQPPPRRSHPAQSAWRVQDPRVTAGEAGASREAGPRRPHAPAGPGAETPPPTRSRAPSCPKLEAALAVCPGGRHSKRRAARGHDVIMHVQRMWRVEMSKRHTAAVVVADLTVAPTPAPIKE